MAKESTAATLLFPLGTYSSEIRNGFSRCPTLLWSNTHLVSSYSKRKEQRRRAVRKAALQGPNPPEEQLLLRLVTLCLLPQFSLPSQCPMVRAFPSHGFCKSKILSTKISTQLRCGKPTKQWLIALFCYTSVPLDVCLLSRSSSTLCAKQAMKSVAHMHTPFKYHSWFSPKSLLVTQEIRQSPGLYNSCNSQCCICVELTHFASKTVSWN